MQIPEKPTTPLQRLPVPPPSPQELRSPAERPVARAQESAIARREGTDRLEISPEARRFSAADELASRLLEGVELRSGPDEAAYLRTGKAEYLERIAATRSAEPEAVSDRILQGITGYVFRAFDAQNPGAGEEGLRRFAAQAHEGVDEGFRQAKEYLEFFEAFDEVVEENAEETVRRVHQGIVAFLERELARIREGRSLAREARGEEPLPDPKDLGPLEAPPDPFQRPGDDAPA